VDAATHVEVGLGADGRSVVRRMHCEAPLLVRVAADPGPGLSLLLVGGAAGPLGGDRLRFDLTVGAGCHVVVRSVAATMVQPGAHGDHSELDYDISVDHDATLDWAPEPTVSVIGSDHRVRLRLAVASTGTATVTERVSLGRHAEVGGRVSLRQRVEVAGEAVLDHETVFQPGVLSGPGAQGSWRSSASTIVIGADLPEPNAYVSATCAGAVVHLSARCALMTALS
jgi:urease accessory protein